MAQLKPTNLSASPSIEQFYGQVKSALTKCPQIDPLVVDLSWVGFVPPEGIIALVTAARLWHGATGCPTLLHNLRPDVHAYLERMDVFSQCGAWLQEERALVEGERFDRSRASSNLLEVLPIAGEEEQNAQDVTVAVTRARQIVDTWFDADTAAVGRLLTMLSEVTSNVVHSRDSGSAVIQRYRAGDARQLGSRVTMAVGDLGIGIEASLCSKPSHRLKAQAGRLGTGSDYIMHALQLGVTSRSTIGGMGLYQVRSLVEDWQGSLTIRSGGSMVRISAGGIERSDDLTDIPGTQVTITVKGSLEGV